MSRRSDRLAAHTTQGWWSGHGWARTQTINRLRRLLVELFPGGAKQFLSSHQARALIATIKPCDIVGKTRRRLVVELIGELEGIDKKIKTVKKASTNWSSPAAPP